MNGTRRGELGASWRVGSQTRPPSVRRVESFGSPEDGTLRRRKSIPPRPSFRIGGAGPASARMCRQRVFSSPPGCNPTSSEAIGASGSAQGVHCGKALVCTYPSACEASVAHTACLNADLARREEGRSNLTSERVPVAVRTLATGPLGRLPTRCFRLAAASHTSNRAPCVG